jgi:signal transduction histidine kinase
VVAIAFSPVKDRTQRLANRLVYGRRLAPYEVLSGLSRSVAEASSPEDVLNELAKAGYSGVGAEVCSVTLVLHDGSRVVTTYPAEARTAIDDPFFVTHQDESLGEVAVTKAASDPLSTQDRDLLGKLASQAGLVLHNARLAIELRARLEEISRQADELATSRTRIVSAANESRRRLEKEITEGPRRDLVALQRHVAEVEELVRHDPAGAASVLESLALKANETLDTLRELARGIYPPLLADKGLVSALEAHVRKHDLLVDLRADGFESVRFDQSVETAAYFCVVETLIGSAGATVVSITRDADELTLVVDPVEAAMSQLQLLEDRVEALIGHLTLIGSSRVEIVLPARALEVTA